MTMSTPTNLHRSKTAAQGGSTMGQQPSKTLGSKGAGILWRRLQEGAWHENTSSSSAETGVPQSFHLDPKPPPLDLGLGLDQKHNIFQMRRYKHADNKYGPAPT
jgi:hypothetical protein